MRTTDTLVRMLARPPARVCCWALATFALLSAGALGASTAPAAPDVDALQQQWREALIRGDVSALETIYSEDLVYVHSDARMQTRQEFLDAIRTGRARFKSLIPQDPARVVRHGDTVVASTRYELGTEGPSGALVKSTHQFLTVFAREGGRWRIVAQQTTRVPPGS
jgi:ketosteroid isomerase-like protein